MEPQQEKIKTVSPFFENVRYVEGSPQNTETLELFVEGIAELKRVNPEIISAILFGSRLKGEARPDSDIDTKIFIDADILESKGVKVEAKADGSVDERVNKDLYDAYKSLFTKVLAKKTSLDESVINEGLYIVPISESIIQKRVEAAIAHQTALNVRFEYNARFFSTKYLHEDFGEAPEYPDDTPPDFSELFGVEIVPGLEKYRELVLDSLEVAGDIGEKVWSNVIQSVFGEGHISSSNTDAYPPTILEAKRKYASL